MCLSSWRHAQLNMEALNLSQKLKMVITDEYIFWKAVRFKNIFSWHGWWQALFNHHPQIKTWMLLKPKIAFFLSPKTGTFGRYFPCVRHNNRDRETYKQFLRVNSHNHYPKSQWTYTHCFEKAEMSFARERERTLSIKVLKEIKG